MKNAIAFKFDERLAGSSQVHGVAILNPDAIAEVLIIDHKTHRSVLVTYKNEKPTRSFSSPLTHENLIQLFTE